MVDTWSEIALVSIAKESGSDIQFVTVTETVDISEGDKGVEHMPVLGGGRLAKFTPEEDTEITLEMFPINIDTTSADGGLFQNFYGGTFDVTEPLQVYNYDNTNSKPNVRDKYRVAVLWTNKPDVVTANGAISAGSYIGLRFVARNCYITSWKTAFTDDVLKATATLSCGSANKNAEPNVIWQSTDGSEELAALAAYTSSTWV